jgi:tetratricopeptide (TPR) repeat protein
MIRFFYVLILLGLFSENIFGQKPDNTKPMYGEVVKDEEYRKLDEEFITSAIKENVTRDSAVNVYLQFAWRHFYYNDLSTSMKRFNQAWLLNPNCADVYYGFAGLLEIRGDKEAAKRFYLIAIDKDGGNTRAKVCLQRLAECKEKYMDYAGRIEAYEKLIAIDSNDVVAYKKLGYFLTDTADKEKAFKFLGKAIELDPNDAMTYNNRGYLYQTLKEYHNAIVDYSKAIELDPKYISAYVNRAFTKMETSDFVSAKIDFEETVKLNSNSGELRMFLGQVKLKLNDKEGACSDFKLAKNLGEENAKKLIKANCR